VDRDVAEETEMRSPHQWRVRGLLCLIPAALALLGLVAGPAAAAEDDKYGTVAVIDASTDSENIVNGEPQVCEFYFQFDLNEQADVVGWVVKTWASSPLTGTTVLQEQGGPTGADGKLRQPDSGSLSLPDGRYNVVWDDESPVDGSNEHQSFVVSCPAAATPTPTPTAGGATPTPTPTATAAGGGGVATQKPTGGVQAAHGTPAITLPPTDTALATRPSNGSSAAAVIGLGLALIAIALLVLAGPGLRASPSRSSRKR
jgi:hypothetical protein